MSAVVEPAPARSAEQPTARSGMGGLLRAEVHRFPSRRFIQVVLAVAVVGWIGATVIALTQFGEPSAGDIADAEQRIAADLQISEQFRQDCLDDPAQIPEGVSPEDFCGPEQTRDDIQLEWYLDKAPFDFESAGTNGALGFAALSAVIAALVGATWIGAEWSTRSLVALLFLE